MSFLYSNRDPVSYPSQRNRHTMSNTMISDQVPEELPADESRSVESKRDFTPVPSYEEEYGYKPIPVLAPVALFLGVSSLIVFVTYFGIIIAAVGVILGTIAMISVAKNRESVGGFKMTAAGLATSVLCLIAGSAILAHDYQTEVPEGFRRVDFTHDISQKGFTADGLHPDVVALDGKRIFLKGFMYPTRQTNGITEFVMAKDNGQCCFGGQPKPADMIYVKLKNSKDGIDFIPSLVSVAGTFRAGVPNRTAEGLAPVYELDAVYIEPARTTF